MRNFNGQLKYSDITPKADFLNRRRLLGTAAGLGMATALGVPASAAKLKFKKTNYKVANGIEITPKSGATTYNNFYEFGTGKDDPAKNAHQLTTDPWSVEIGGMVGKPGTYDLADLIGGIPLEERIYRFRCVEAWSMVVPWIGFSLSKVLKKVDPAPGAKYVAFETLNRPSEMPGIGWRPQFPWPYVEGLRMDEAMHPLTMIATGMYGEEMPKQNGAPLRLVVPWKYGYKSIKSIVKITVVNKQPPTTWNRIAANEYGFFSNVNPNRDHPRWSQKRERVISGGLFKRDTPMFNGYGQEVASMYAGMDLIKFH
ncbi:MAG: protein-methionine-sulfoxide reductase catalytic subunit MsrP [Pseudomonadota bacterium]